MHYPGLNKTSPVTSDQDQGPADEEAKAVEVAEGVPILVWSEDADLAYAWHVHDTEISEVADGWPRTRVVRRRRVVRHRGRMYIEDPEEEESPSICHDAGRRPRR